MLVLYHGELSTCAQKVRLLLAEKGLEWESHHLDLRKADQHQPDYLAINPNGVVPTLIHDGQVVMESTVILEYLEDCFPDPAFRPAAALEQARMRLWMKALDESIHANCGVLSSAIAFRHQPGHEAQILTMVNAEKRARKMASFKLGIEAPLFRTALGRFTTMLDDMETTLAKSDWLVGETLSLADISYVPYCARVEQLGMGALIDGRQGVAGWYARIKARPSFDVAITQWASESYLTLMAEQGARSWPRIAEMATDL